MVKTDLTWAKNVSKLSGNSYRQGDTSSVSCFFLIKKHTLFEIRSSPPPLFKAIIYMVSSLWSYNPLLIIVAQSPQKNNPLPLRCVVGFCNLQFLVPMDTILLYTTDISHNLKSVVRKRKK